MDEIGPRRHSAPADEPGSPGWWFSPPFAIRGPADTILRLLEQEEISRRKAAELLEYLWVPFAIRAGLPPAPWEKLNWCDDQSPPQDGWEPVPEQQWICRIGYPEMPETLRFGAWMELGKIYRLREVPGVSSAISSKTFQLESRPDEQYAPERCAADFGPEEK